MPPVDRKPSFLSLTLVSVIFVVFAIGALLMIDCWGWAPAFGLAPNHAKIRIFTSEKSGTTRTTLASIASRRLSSRAALLRVLETIAANSEMRDMPEIAELEQHIHVEITSDRSSSLLADLYYDGDSSVGPLVLKCLADHFTSAQVANVVNEHAVQVDQLEKRLSAVRAEQHRLELKHNRLTLFIEMLQERLRIARVRSREIELSPSASQPNQLANLEKARRSGAVQLADALAKNSGLLGNITRLHRSQLVLETRLTAARLILQQLSHANLSVGTLQRASLMGVIGRQLVTGRFVVTTLLLLAALALFRRRERAMHDVIEARLTLDLPVTMVRAPERAVV